MSPSEREGSLSELHPEAGASQVVIVRYGELFLKGLNRSFFERRLLDNTRRAVAHLPGARIERAHGRVLVWPPPADEEGGARCLAALGRVFGASSLSICRVVERDLSAIYSAAVAQARDEVSRRGSVRGSPPTFKVESRRSDKRFHPSSPELSKQAGAAIVEALGLPVDVHQPDFTIGIEIGFERAFVYSDKIPGAGGLPVGVTGPVELLLSGGIDSPVAGWLMLKRGCRLGAIYFHSFPYTGEKSKDKVVTLARQLASWQLGPIALKVVPFTDVQKRLRDTGDGRLAVVLYRRMMLRIAERIAHTEGGRALVTGEALAQVASQTLENLSVIGEVATLPILRPCLAHDKQETIALARRIGTYETSILPYDDCCSLFVPEHPETRAKREAVVALERKLDLEALVNETVAKVERIDCQPLLSRPSR